PMAVSHLAALMLEHGVEVRVLPGHADYLIPLAQPYGRFVEEMMGVQRYPEVHPAPGSGILEPYDVAAWSLPLMMGVTAERVRLTEGETQSATAIKTVAPLLQGGTEPVAKYYTCNYHMNNVFALVNAMQKAGGQVFLTYGTASVPALI